MSGRGRNQLTIDAVIATRDELRYTPSGVPVIDVILAHESLQSEAGRPRRVECELRAKAMGEQASALAKIAPGEAIRCSGFLARTHRSGRGLRMHITEFELLRGE